MPPGQATVQPVDQPNPIAILLVEGNALVRAGLRAVLEHIPGVTVLAAADPEDGYFQYTDKECDVVVINVGSGSFDGVELTRRIARSGGRVLAISTNAQEGLVMDAVLAGATGVLLSHAGPDALASAVRALANGEAYLPEPSARMRIEPSFDGELSLRQRQVLRHIAEGVPTREIARRLGVSVKTVETHRANLMRRLRIRDVPGLVRYAIRSGLVSPEH